MAVGGAAAQRRRARRRRRGTAVGEGVTGVSWSKGMVECGHLRRHNVDGDGRRDGNAAAMTAMDGTMATQWR